MTLFSVAENDIKLWLIVLPFVRGGGFNSRGGDGDRKSGKYKQKRSSHIYKLSNICALGGGGGRIH